MAWKTVVLAATLLLLFCSTALWGMESGDTEFSGSASYMSVKPEWAEEGVWYLNMAARVGIFLTPVFEIEPELMMSKWQESDLGHILSCNLIVNMAPSGHDNPVAFLLGGAGFSNTTLYLPGIPYPNIGRSPDLIINVGGGLKVFAMDNVAMRVEYRYQRFMDVTTGDGGFRGDMSYHLLLVGFSIFRR